MRKSSDKLINYGQVYNKVHGTSAKTAVFFIKRTIDERFTVTIATDMERNIATQVMHSDEENNMTCFLLLLFLSHF